MLLAAAGMRHLKQLGVASSYAAAVLPALITIGVGMGMTMASAINCATLGVRRPMPASTRRRVSRAVDRWLLAALDRRHRRRDQLHHERARTVDAAAARHAYSVAFAVAVGLVAAGSIIAAAPFEHGTDPLEVDFDAGAASAMGH